jgi:hypothetical protein
MMEDLHGAQHMASKRGIIYITTRKATIADVTLMQSGSSQVNLNDEVLQAMHEV